MSRFVLTAQLQLQAPNNVAQVVRQIQSQLNNVNVNIQVQNTGQAQRQLQRITQQTNQATTAAERMGRAFAVSVRRFAAFSIATRAVGLFTSTLSDAVQAAIDFKYGSSSSTNLDSLLTSEQREEKIIEEQTIVYANKFKDDPSYAPLDWVFSYGEQQQ
jgi:hypothetical protein